MKTRTPLCEYLLERVGEGGLRARHTKPGLLRERDKVDCECVEVCGAAFHAAHEKVVAQHSRHGYGNANASCNQRLSDWTSNHRNACRLRMRDRRQRVDDAEHGPKQTDEWGRAADRCQHVETRFGAAALRLDLLAQMALEQIMTTPAVFKVSRAAIVCAGQRVEARRCQSAKRAVRTVEASSYRQAGSCPEAAAVASAAGCRARRLK